MKNILFITNYKGMSPFIQSFSKMLSSLNHDVYIYDTEEYRIFKDDKIIYQNKTFFKLTKLNIPIISRLIRKGLLYISLSRLKKTDIIIVLYLQYTISTFGKLLKQKCEQLNVIYAGSDFYRSCNKAKEKAKDFLAFCDNIILAGEKHKSNFNDFYNNQYDNKIRFIGVGLDELETIDKVKKGKSNSSLKKELGISTDKKIVTIGYNGIKEQQHIRIIKELRNINKENICIILPMTYGLTVSYKKQIENLLNKYGFEFIIFDKYLEKTDIANIRLVTDVTLNFQISDGASRSLMEHLYAENIVIVGDWLPYDFWDETGVFYHKCELDNIGRNLKTILENINTEQINCHKNKAIIRENWSWNAKLPQWEEMFNS